MMVIPQNGLMLMMGQNGLMMVITQNGLMLVVGQNGLMMVKAQNGLMMVITQNGLILMVGPDAGEAQLFTLNRHSEDTQPTPISDLSPITNPLTSVGELWVVS